MSVAFVKHIGIASASNSTTTVVTVPAGGVAVGNLLVVRSLRSTPSGVADTASNTYSLIANSAVYPPVYVYATRVTAALVAGNTITMSHPMGSNGMAIDEFSGVTITTDGSSAPSGSSTTPSATITPAASGLVLVALSINDGAPDVFTNDTDADNGDTWHLLTASTAGSGGDTDSVRGAYKVTTSPGANTYAPTLGTSRDWGVVLVGFVPVIYPSVSFPGERLQRPAMFRPGLAR